MLVVRYFAYVGGALLALLLVCAAVLPKPPATEGTIASGGDVPAIRINSERKWPERVVLDTNAQMPASPMVAQAQAPAQPPAAAEAAANARTREAFAEVPANQPKQVAEVKKREPRPVVKRKFARARVAPSPYAPQYAYAPQHYGPYGRYGYGRQPMQVAQQPHFGFFW